METFLKELLSEMDKIEVRGRDNQARFVNVYDSILDLVKLIEQKKAAKQEEVDDGN